MMNILEKLIGRKAHSRKLSVTDYIEESFNDIWVSLVIAYLLILAALVSGLRKDKS